MSKSKQRKIDAYTRMADGFGNSLLRIGNRAENTFRANRYSIQNKTFQRQDLEAAYQSSWICGLTVDIIAEDMTREGIEIKHENTDQIDRLNTALDDYQLWDRLSDAIKWSRLYGGSIAVLLFDGDDMSTPLTNVRKNSFKGIHVFDRWQVQSSEELVQEMGRDFGKPRYYEVLPGAAGVEIPGGKIHYSRVLRFEGRKLPYYLAQMYQGWGASVLENFFDRVEMFDLASQSAAQLISKSFLRYYKVRGLRDILTNDIARTGFLKQMDAVRLFQSSEGMTLGDTEDDFQTFSYSFAGLPELILQFGQQVSGATGIPLVRLFGQSPAGFNSTGESDLRIYYDNIKHLQDSTLRYNLKRLLRALFASEFGESAPAEFTFEFNPLWQMSSEQKASTAQAAVGSIVQSLESGIISTSVAVRELKRLSDTVGIFASITDEDIAEIEAQEAELAAPSPNFEGGEANGEPVSGTTPNG